MRRILPIILAVLGLVASSGLARSATLVPDGYALSARQELAAGVEHSTLTRAEPASRAHVARIAPGAPVALRAVSSDNRITHHGDPLETPSSMCRRVHCIVAVNADFHYVSSHEPYGGVISGGRMLRSPAPGRPQLTVTRDGRVVAGPMEWSAALRTDDGALPISGINTTLAPAGEIVLYTPDWGTSTRATGASELVVRPAGPLGAVNAPVGVELVSFGPGGSSPIPPDGAVLSATGAGAEALADVWSRMAAGTLAPRADIAVSSPLDAAESLGGNPMLVAGGQPAFPPATDGFTRNRNPRTVIGWNGSGEIFLVAVDGRQSSSRGMALAELAEFMLRIGATDALNFDGGGGTTFVVDGVVTNQPVDDGSVGAERGAVNSLVVVPTSAPPTPGPRPDGGPVPGSSTGSGAGQAPSPAAVTPPRSGYWMVGADGAVYPFGDARPWGDALGYVAPHSAVDLAPTPSAKGYWIVDSIGRVYAFGDARHIGNADPGVLAAGERVTSLSPTPSGFGYWIFTSRGRVLRFGDAPFVGDMAKAALNGPVLDSIPTPSGRGYYMVASDGGIFAFGDARFYGSMGSVRLNAPVQSLVPDPDGRGYWLVASDGGVFAFDAPFRGSMGGVRLSRPVTGMVPNGSGYLMVGEDGGIFNFSDREFFGSLGDHPPASPIVSVAALDD